MNYHKKWMLVNGLLVTVNGAILLAGEPEVLFRGLFLMGLLTGVICGGLHWIAGLACTADENCGHHKPSEFNKK